MGAIIYKPHCAKCGALINDEVIYKKLEPLIGNRYMYPYNFIEIEPNRCESCGEWFEGIEVPLPKEG